MDLSKCSQPDVFFTDEITKKTWKNKTELEKGRYGCDCGNIMDTNKDDFLESTVGSSLSSLPHIICPQCKKCLGCASKK